MAFSMLNSSAVKTKDVIAVFETLQAVADLFDPPISKSAVSQWGEDIPALREYQLRERVPDIDQRIAALKKVRARAAA